MTYQPTLIEKAVVPGLFAASTAAGVAYQVSQPPRPINPIPVPHVVAQGAMMGFMAPFFLMLVGLMAWEVLSTVANGAAWVVLRVQDLITRSTPFK